MSVLPPSSAGSSPAKLTDSLGCVAGHLAQSQELAGSGTQFFRKRMASNLLGHVSTPASNRGYLVGISLDKGHRRKIFNGRHAAAYDFEPGSIYIRPFADDYRADMNGPFDFLLMELSSAALERATRERGISPHCALNPVAGVKDEVLSHLACALLPALQQPERASKLFVDQMSEVISTHLFEHYGSAPSQPEPRTRRLSRRQENLAKELLRSKLDGDVSISDIADACQLSRSYFTHAFKQTTGQTPLQWQQAQRVEMACSLLAQPAFSLAQIAAVCGFADQSHFTRAFTRLKGQTPGAWRREASMVKASRS